MKDFIESILVIYVFLNVVAGIVISFGVRDACDKMISDGIKIKHLILIPALIPAIIFAILIDIIASICENISNKSFWNKTIIKLKK